MDKINENVSFEDLLNETIKELNVGEVVTGTVIDITPQKEIFVDIGYKADGIIPSGEYLLDDDETVESRYKVGDTITAVIVKLNDGVGNVLLSANRARKESDKKELAEKIKADDVLSGKVTEVNDKGLIVNYNTVRIFIPLSLSGIRRDEDAHTYKGKHLRFKVTEYEPERNRIIGSVRAVSDVERKQKSDKFWNEIEIGKKYEGRVTSLSEYGAFVDIEGVTQGLLHISEITWQRDKKPSDILEVGQIIEVTVKELDKENKRIKLSYSGKGPNPWETVDERYKIGDVVNVQIVNFASFGAFAKVEDGVEGLIHISQISVERINKAEDVLEVGQKVNAKIIGIDKENRKMELSIKELEGTSDEYKDVEE